MMIGREMPKRLAEMQVFPVIQISDDAAASPETTGSKAKFWYRGEDGASYLFKESRERTGEHWSEKIAYELALLMELPCAAYDLACWKGKNGVVSKRVVPDDRSRLVLGNEILFRFNKDYNPDESYKNKYYTVKLVMKYLKNIPIYYVSDKSYSKKDKSVLGYKGIEAPHDKSSDQKGCLFILGDNTKMADVFIGYLLLDAWIGNTDRHHENWAFIFSGSSVTLAPTYDHASCLGRELTQEKKEAHLLGKAQNRSVGNYCSKAKAALYREMVDRKPLSPIEAFLEAGAMCKEAALFWQEKIENISNMWIDRIFELMPEGQMTKMDKAFAKAILVYNRETIRRKIESLK